MNLVHTDIGHLSTLMSWFPDKESSYNWCGPGLRYPFTDETFQDDIQWGKMPTYSLLDSENQLIGFGQYYEKYGRCHLARLVISPFHRSKGLGYGFINKLMEIGMADLGLSECSLFVVSSNDKALYCYRALNFKKADYPREQEYYNDINFMVREHA